MLKILAISGSLRKHSTNTALLRAMSKLAPQGVIIEIYTGMSSLPLFNPDDDVISPSSIIAFRKLVSNADGIIIASPEYAHGVSGVLKNALDWLVSSGEFIGKPTAILNASSRATHAHQSLIEIINTMSAYFVQEASFIIPITPGIALSEDDIANNFRDIILLSIANLIAEISVSYP